MLHLPVIVVAGASLLAAAAGSGPAVDHLPAALAAARPAAPTVRVMTVSEAREKRLIEMKQSGGFSMPSENILTLTLLIEGDVVPDLTHYGREAPEVTAVDDTGQSLDAKGHHMTGTLDRDHMWFFQDEAPADKIKVDVQLEAPKRSATKLATVEGAIGFEAATVTEVRLSDLATHVGASVEHAALEQAKVSVKIAAFDPGNPMQAIELELGDPDERVTSFDIVDGSGTSLSNGYSSFGFGGTRQVQLSADGRLPDDARLVLGVVTARRTVSIPFELKDVELP
jgi:hypothetical protein